MTQLPPRSAAPTAKDGRARRREQNHRLIVDTCYELVRSGVVEPTAEQVAERVGLGRRTVFRQFQDMETLALAVHERVVTEVAALLEVVEAFGDFETDLRAMIRRRARVFEHITPFRRAAAVMRHRSAVVKTQEDLLCRSTRARLEAIIGPYLPAGNASTLEALDLLLSYEAWERLRHQQMLTVPRAIEVLSEAALTLTGLRR